jgi:hypothetical protein
LVILVFITLSLITGKFGDKLSRDLKPDSIRYSLQSSTSEIKIEDSKSNKELKYITNSPLSAGFSVTEGLVSIGTSFKQAKNDEEEHSDYYDYFIRTPLSKGLFEIYYSQFEGFKLSQSSDDLLDIKNITYGAHFTYYFDPGFNLETQTGHFSINKISGYSSFINFGYAKIKTESSDPLIPTELEPEFDEYIGLDGIEQDSVSVIYGVSGQYIFRKYYVQGSIGLGMNLSKVRYDGSNLKDTTKTNPSYRIQMNLGYEFSKSLLGIELNSLSIADQQNQNQLSSTRSDFLLYYNYFF